MNAEKYPLTHKSEKNGFKTYKEAKQWADNTVKKYLELSSEPKSVSVLILKGLGFGSSSFLTGIKSYTIYSAVIEIEFEADVE